MKKVLLGSTVLAVMLFSALLIFAGPTETGISQEIAEGKQLVDSGASCSSLNDGQLEAIGEYLMEQMHPGEAHELMHQMMGFEEGTPEHDAMHINMAEHMYCGNFTSTEYAGYSGMMNGYGYSTPYGMMGVNGMMQGYYANNGGVENTPSARGCGMMGGW
ncbi:MAG: hypothetical protein V1494_05765 [Candidatus Diapherotrites archaeon]